MFVNCLLPVCVVYQASLSASLQMPAVYRDYNWAPIIKIYSMTNPQSPTHAIRCPHTFHATTTQRHIAKKKVFHAQVENSLIENFLCRYIIKGIEHCAPRIITNPYCSITHVYHEHDFHVIVCQTCQVRMVIQLVALKVTTDIKESLFIVALHLRRNILMIWYVYCNIHFSYA